MRRLFIALLMILSFVTVALVAPAHGARMATFSQTIASEHEAPHRTVYSVLEACQEDRICSGSDGFCDFVCSGMGYWFLSDQPGNAFQPTSARWALPQTPNLAGLSPERNERPPNPSLAENQWLHKRTPI